jgi:fused signal recognition particle receptor
MPTWIEALSKTRRRLRSVLSRVFTGAGAVDEAALEELEETLLRADVAMPLVMEWTAALTREGGHRPPAAVLRQLLLDALEPAPPFEWASPAPPHTLLLVGVNGTGKTTSAAKLARRAAQAGRQPLLAATDTFRAAGADQLRIWAGRVGCDVVAGQQGADAAAVAYDALEAAHARGRDTVIIDTAGRMHTRQPLMNELAKVHRTVTARLGRAPDETWIVLDASMGQNAIQQARHFHALVPLSGCIVAKLDGTGKAGFVFSVVKELKLPVRFAGLGEGMDDLAPFDPERFVDALLGRDGVGEEESE